MLAAGVTLPPFNPWASWIDIDELPIDQRVEINRRRIASDLATETDPERIKLLQGWLAEYVDPIDGTTTVPQVLLYEPALGQVAIAFGDVSNADYVAVAVPGTGTTMENYAIGDGGINRGESHRAIQLRMAMEQVAVGDAAVIAWLGYPAPSWSLSDHPGLSGPGEEGGPALASFVTGLPVAAGARRAVVGHSYGTYVVGEAIQAGMPVDNVISLGSPGMGVDHVSDLNLPDEADVARDAPAARPRGRRGPVRHGPGLAGVRGDAPRRDELVIVLALRLLDTAEPEADRCRGHRSAGRHDDVRDGR